MSEYIVEFGYEPTPTNTPELPIGEEVVRCRDCKHLVAYPDAKYCAGLSSAFFEVSDEDFCAWAERRDA